MANNATETIIIKVSFPDSTGISKVTLKLHANAKVSEAVRKLLLRNPISNAEDFGLYLPAQPSLSTSGIWLDLEKSFGDYILKEKEVSDNFNCKTN
jgi:hypothetical protein